MMNRQIHLEFISIGGLCNSAITFARIHKVVNPIFMLVAQLSSLQIHTTYLDGVSTFAYNWPQHRIKRVL